MYKTSSNINEISNNNHHHHHHHQSTDSALQNQNTNTPTADIIYTKQKTRSSKGRILIVDDDPDIGSLLV